VVDGVTEPAGVPILIPPATGGVLMVPAFVPFALLPVAGVVAATGAAVLAPGTLKWILIPSGTVFQV